MKTKISGIAFILLLLLSPAISYGADSFWADAILSTFIFAWLIKIANSKSSVNIMFISGFGTFLYYPAVLNSYVLGSDFYLYYASAILSYYFLVSTKDLIFIEGFSKAPFKISLFLVYATILCLLSILGAGALYVLAPFVMLYVASLRQNKIGVNLFLTIVFLGVYLFYINYGWSGMGRVASIGPLLVAILYFLYIFKIPAVKILFATLPGLAGMGLVGRKSVSFDFDLLEVLNDSAFGPYRLATTFIENYNKNGFDIFGLFDQFIFALFSFVPREIWPGKPNGFGYQYTVDNLDQGLVDAGHSIASTFIGEHIYYAGWFGLLTGFISVWFVAKICKVLYSFQPLNGLLVILISCNMMVYVWGGMTSLSARVIFPIIGFMPVLVFYYLISNNKSKIFKNDF